MMHFNRSSFGFIIMLNTLTLGYCGMVATPQNEAVIKGDTLEMQCITDNSSRILTWSFFRTSQPISISLFSSGKTTQEIADISTFRTKEAWSNTSVILFSNSVQLTDAGIYTCVVVNGMGQQSHNAHLTVFEDVSSCGTRGQSIHSRHNQTQFFCEVNFRGSWAPIMTWSRKDGYTETPITAGVEIRTISNFSVASTLTVDSDLLAKPATYICKTFFSEPNANDRVTATNIPDYNLECPFTKVGLLATLAHTTISAGAIEKDSSVAWFSPMISVATSAVFVLITLPAIVCCVNRRRSAAASLKTKSLSNTAASQDSSQNYDSIEEENETTTQTFSSIGETQSGPGYSGLLILEQTVAGAYETMENIGGNAEYEGREQPQQLPRLYENVDLKPHELLTSDSLNAVPQ